MSPKRWPGPSLIAAALLTATLAAAAWATSDGSCEPVGKTAITQYPREYWQFMGWYQKAIRPGRVTEAEVIAIFGRRYKDLDRPDRDRIRTIQYRFSDLGIALPRDVPWDHKEWIVFHFDRKSKRLLQATEPSGAICGFCPHVFAEDATGWRLEGKALAGCVGAAAEGTDTLLLPRATAHDGSVRVRLANLAPETESLDEAQLGIVRLERDEELDLDTEGRPFVWTPLCDLRADAEVRLSGSAAGRVLVLEVRNTAAFETAMRRWLYDGDGPSVEASLTVRFDDGSAQVVRPVGTKFLRRIVVPVPAGARRATFDGAEPYWLVRRLWIGHGHCAAVVWRHATPDTTAAELLAGRDRRRLTLLPDEEVTLTFPVPRDSARWGYVLRLTGYYEFLPH